MRWRSWRGLCLAGLWLALAPAVAARADSGILDLIAGCLPTAPTLTTPYASQDDMNTINEAYSENDTAPWGFEHRGIDFFPYATLAPFQAAAPGRVEQVDLFYNTGNGFYQVNVDVRCNARYWYGYAFEPMSGEESVGQSQVAQIVVSPGDRVAAGDLIGYLVKPSGSDGVHVHFALYREWDSICPEPFFTSQAAASVLTILHRQWPGAQICYPAP